MANQFVNCEKEKNQIREKGERKKGEQKIYCLPKEEEKEAMNRTEGLVQRRTVAKDQQASNSNSSCNHSGPSSTKNNGSDFNDDISNGCAIGGGSSGYEIDADSKETRLTLMEEVLLLGLKDKEVSSLLNYLLQFTNCHCNFKGLHFILE